MTVEEINKVYECCKDSFHRHCDGCPVTDDCCHDKMPLFVLKYALELLEDEEELGEELGNAVELIRKKDERIKKLLKEQETVEHACDILRANGWTETEPICSECDAIHVVRCKDCKFREECMEKEMYDPEWYCADGVRKEG